MKPTSCFICQREFSRPDNLRRHLRTAHGSSEPYPQMSEPYPQITEPYPQITEPYSHQDFTPPPPPPDFTPPSQYLTSLNENMLSESMEDKF